MKKTETKKCYFYTRVSTEIQVDGYSLEAQYNELEREAKHRGFVIAHHFSDEGKSGKNMPYFQIWTTWIMKISITREGKQI